MHTHASKGLRRGEAPLHGTSAPFTGQCLLLGGDGDRGTELQDGAEVACPAFSPQPPHPRPHPCPCLRISSRRAQIWSFWIILPISPVRQRVFLAQNSHSEHMAGLGPRPPDALSRAVSCHPDLGSLMPHLHLRSPASPSLALSHLPQQLCTFLEVKIHEQRYVIMLSLHPTPHFSVPRPHGPFGNQVHARLWAAEPTAGSFRSSGSQLTSLSQRDLTIQTCHSACPRPAHVVTWPSLPTFQFLQSSPHSLNLPLVHGQLLPLEYGFLEGGDSARLAGCVYVAPHTGTAYSRVPSVLTH